MSNELESEQETSGLVRVDPEDYKSGVRDGERAVRRVSYRLPQNELLCRSLFGGSTEHQVHEASQSTLHYQWSRRR